MYPTALVLTAVGGLNWGLVGLFDFNLVSFLFGADSILTNIIYILVGIASVYLVTAYFTRTASTEVPRDVRERERYEQRTAHSQR